MSETVITRARRERDELRSRLAMVERFIRSYEAFEQGRTPLHRDTSGARTAPRGQPRLIAEAIAAVLRDGPKTQAEIVARLEQGEVTVPSANKKMYINTILWRNPDRFHRNDDRTYTLLPTPSPQ